MPERILTSSGNGKLEALEETPLPKEDELPSVFRQRTAGDSGFELST